jgi:hypothetical protein
VSLSALQQTDAERHDEQIAQLAKHRNDLQSAYGKSGSELHGS